MTFIIAEVGINHDGSLDKAKRLIDAARAAEANAVKFQFFKSRKLWGDERIQHLELRFSEMMLLHRYCEQAGIEFMCTPFGVEEVILLKQLLKRYKVASGCLTRKPILEGVRDSKLPMILSTGMSGWREISDALEITGTDNVTLLHCTSSYPCAIEDVNLKAMGAMRILYQVPVGYSDHTQGITIAIAAAAKCATVIEKHITLDRTLSGPDHKASIEPDEFRVMVSAIRTVEKALGDGEKRVMESEEDLRKAWREPLATHS